MLYHVTFASDAKASDRDFWAAEPLINMLDFNFQFVIIFFKKNSVMVISCPFKVKKLSTKHYLTSKKRFYYIIEGGYYTKGKCYIAKNLHIN